jgi:hypothetical protein
MGIHYHGTATEPDFLNVKDSSLWPPITFASQLRFWNLNAQLHDQLCRIPLHEEWGFLTCAANQNTWSNYRLLSLYIPTKVGISSGRKQDFPTPTKGDTGGDEHSLREICIRVPCSSNHSSFPFLLHIHDHNRRLRVLREVWNLKLSAARPWPGFTDRRLKGPVSC